ncbi:PAS fold protein (plasmid) [Aquisphaera giovannonii]|uniref:PAS fold protein n=1 Tax=Aquisphaera giovannonii TaxID=406548 RepID=A0A5B9WHT8_9BACT|nr:PAS domain-containing protein [Aquisphaera giovannonii]QEH39330.1 PAS fold protein [Aquisphaera giovannonii]
MMTRPLSALDPGPGFRHPPPQTPALPRLAEAIVATVREPLLVLDDDLVVHAANPAFCDAFRIPPAETLGRRLADVGLGAWDIPALRSLLGRIIPSGSCVEGFELEDDFPLVGRRSC